MVFKHLFGLTVGATAVSAHGLIDQLIINGKSYVGFNPTAAPWVPDQGTISWPSWNTDTGPVYGNNVGHPDIICQINATNAKISAVVPAGSDIPLHWTTWPDSHHGPIFAYLADCGGVCTNVDKTKLQWVKIAEEGRIQLGAGGGSPGFWVADQLIANDGNWTVRIPSSIKPGNYVLRHEILALHSAYDVGGAQFYPQCISIQITGSGTASPPGVVGQKLYSPTDPGVHFNIYNDESNPNYVMPGPALCKFEV
ncbi:polysaccharide monooxygenase Cel61a [Colletotrichum spaethianum]|uniref:lytic cellulose monooxygenase (C4-dehydrogenating) n=1 Tax=Colletotrichum spaethianum TaxID=700344 RepID=A0AA37UJH6_9PEZI|nr:polysaccharide monooxygenase Cel61a [Colletotrichum spaethianum]GKT49664.1 polysaccharide monooxygenase Cel61a [Colletotrichum spaethianum]